MKYPGRFLTSNAPTVTTTSAPGIWTLEEQVQYQKAGTWPQYINSDPQFPYVTMLLHGDGTNGAQNNTFLDSSTNNFTITRTGSTTQGTWSPYGANWSNAFLTSYLSIPSNAAFAFGTGDFTIELWSYYASTTADYIFYDGRGTSGLNTNVVLYTTGGTLNVAIGGSGVISTSVPSANTWHHFAITRSGTSMKLFVDGTQAGSTATNSTNILAYGVTIATTGESTYMAQYYVNGYISNVRVVKGTAVYTSNFTPPTAPLTAISGTSLLTCQSNRFIDNSSNAFAITVNGSPSVQRFSPFSPTLAYSASVIGGSGYFDGSSYLTTSGGMPSGASSAFTMECWIYLTDLTNYRTITRDPGTTSFDFGVATTGVIQLYLGGGSTLICASSAGVIKTNTWYHIALTRTTGNVYTIYVNGVSVASGTNSTSISATTTIGYNSYSAIYDFVGYLSDFRATNTVVYTTTFTPPTVPLTAISGTTLLLNFTNAGILDNAEMNDLVTVGSAQVSTSVVKYGTGSMKFNGTTDYLFAPSLPVNIMGTGDFTIEMWVYPTTVTGTFYLIALGSETTARYNVMLVNGVLTTNYYGLSSVTLGGSVSASSWTHIAITRSGSTIRGFVNGTLLGTTDTNSSAIGNGPLKVASDANGSSTLNGYIDDLRITKGYARYTANFTPPTAAFPNQ